MHAALAQTEAFGEAMVEGLSEDDSSAPVTPPEIDHAIDINSDEVQLLTSIGLITPIQENALQVYISVNGPLIDIYELQAVPFFDLPSIRNILPFISVGVVSLDAVKLVRSISSGKNEVVLRLRHTVQQQKGYREAGPYRGGRQGLFVRYTHTGKRLSIALLAEKDPGEQWIDQTRKQFLDFQSFHVVLHKPTNWIESIIIGDFNAAYGMGLVRSSAFTTGKSALTTNILRSGMPLRPLRSAREGDFMRGIGVTFNPHQNIRLNLSLSRTKRDATINSKIELHGNDTAIINTIRSLSTSGYHRTDNEISKKANINYTTIGLNTTINLGKLRIESNSLYQHVNLPFDTNSSSGPAGNSTLNNSLGLRYFIHNLLLFGEFALDECRNSAMIAGTMIPFGKSLTVSLMVRKLSPEYSHLGARTFSENTKAENETGIYTGLELQLTKDLRLNAYADQWRHPAPRFGIDFPSAGVEHLVRITYSRRKQFELYAQWRSEKKEYNSNNTDLRIPQTAIRHRQYFRIHFSRTLSRNFELRNRIEFSRYQLGNTPSENGLFITQDFLYKPLGKHFHITGRIAYFQTDSYSSRIYAYENDLSYQFSIPAHAGNGTRCYLNFKYKGIRNTTIEFRIAHIQMFDRSTIGSGNDEVAGAGKTDLKLQLAFRF